MTPVESKIRLFNWNSPRSPNLQQNGRDIDRLTIAFSNKRGNIYRDNLRHRQRQGLAKGHPYNFAGKFTRTDFFFFLFFKNLAEA